MFTGIITHLGRVASITPARSTDADTRLRVDVAWRAEEMALGASIACSGVCLTVVARGDGWFEADASRETCRLTTIGGWTAGQSINLERALKVGDELGGHIVSGHVDGLGVVESIEPVGASEKWCFGLPPELARYVARKGSIAVDGVSLTVNAVDRAAFEVNIIPHTRAHTTFAGLVPGASVNLEVDMLARYAAQLLDRD